MDIGLQSGMSFVSFSFGTELNLEVPFLSNDVFINANNDMSKWTWYFVYANF